MVLVRLLTFILLISASTEELSEELLKLSHNSSCPLGFSEFTTNTPLKLCYRYKPPEHFDDVEKDCIGNLYTLEFAADFYSKRKKADLEIWTDYVRKYEGGPLVKWSRSEGMGRVLNEIYQPETGAESDQSKARELMCSSFNTTTRIVRPAPCHGKYDRLCVVRPYERLKNEGCPGTFLRLYSPLPACLAPTAARQQDRFVTWKRAQFECSKWKKSTLLQSAYIYANHRDLQPSEEPQSTSIPIGCGLKIDKDGTGVKSFEERKKSPYIVVHQTITALDVRNWSLSLVEKEGATFYQILCEQLVSLGRLGMVVKYNESTGVLSLTVNSSSVADKGIWCFTDARTIYPERVTVKRLDSDRFTIEPVGDGFYWCVNVDTTKFLPEESNTALYIGDKSSIADVYAIKLYWEAGYTFSTLNRVVAVIRESLDALFFKKKCQQNRLHGSFGDLTNSNTDQKPSAINNKVSQDGSSQHSSSRTSMKYLRPKRTYPDGHTLLLHLQLDPKFSPLSPANHGQFHVIYMRPVYFCQRNSTISSLDSNELENCLKYTCEGSFIDVLRFNNTVPDCSNQLEIFDPILTEVTSADDFSADDISADDISIGTTETPHPHAKLIEGVIENLSQIIEAGELNVTTINVAVSQVNELLKLDPFVPVPPEVLSLIDSLGSNVLLGEEGQAVVAAPNLVIAAADTRTSGALAGIRVRNNDTFSNDTVHFIWAGNSSSDTVSQRDEMEVKLPSSVQSVGRISFVVFRDDRAFVGGTARRVNSRIISVKVANTTTFQDGEFIEINFVPFAAPLDNETRTCGYWNFTASSSAAGTPVADWSTNGCSLRPAINFTSLDVCACNHLTHFTELITLRTANSSLSAANEAALTVISTVGCSFSLLGLAIIGLTAAIFRSWRKEFSNKVWLHLSASITLLIVAFFTISLVDFKAGQYTSLCVAIGIILHYSVLSSFCWMFVAAVLSYQKLVVVFSRGESHQLLKACVFSWGFPCIIIGALLVVDPHNYEYKYKVNETVYMYTFCYPTNLGFWLTVFLPVLTAVAANTLLFCVIVFSVFEGSRVVRHNSSNEAVRCITVSFLLIFLFGITWIFGLFAEVTFAAYIFCVTATFQGFVLFIFFVAGNKKTRDLWLNFIKLKKNRKIPTSSNSTTITRLDKDAKGPLRTAGFELTRSVKHETALLMQKNMI